jgi:5,5'-dehydrodivanillate O-demethylase oxygenase subunit
MRAAEGGKPMLSRDENERFTRVGAETPMGKLLRRYWHPVGCGELVTTKPQRVKVLGEELVLYRGARGKPVLMQLRCAHRSLALDYGRVEGDSIRCPYHGWLYDRTGRCVAQPAEPEGSSFKEKIRLIAYPTQEVSGLVFAYMGPEPAPVLPLYDVLRMDQGTKEIMVWKVDTSWFQSAENIVDMAHLSWLHGHTFPAYSGRKISYHFERADYGASLEMRIEGVATPNVTPYGFPATNRFNLPPAEPQGPPMQVVLYRVPRDETSHENFFVAFRASDQPLSSDQRVVHAKRWNVKFGEYRPLATDWWGIDVSDQDRMAFEQQGVIVDRTQEHLVSSDAGILLMRRMMREGFEAIEKGEDPPCIIRDPAKQNVEFKLSMAVISQNRAEDTDYSVGLFSECASEPA